jgi:hypothetical protein
VFFGHDFRLTGSTWGASRLRAIKLVRGDIKIHRPDGNVQQLLEKSDRLIAASRSTTDRTARRIAVSRALTDFVDRKK